MPLQNFCNYPWVLTAFSFIYEGKVFGQNFWSVAFNIQYAASFSIVSENIIEQVNIIAAVELYSKKCFDYAVS